MNNYERCCRFASIAIFSLLLLSASSNRSFAAKTAQDYLNSGIGYEYDLDFVDAITQFNQAIGLDPNNAPAYMERGWCYFKNWNNFQAIDDETKAIELEPFSPDSYLAYVRRGAVYISNGEYNAAIDDESKAIDMNAGRADAYYERGCAYGSQGNNDQEITDESKAIEIDSTNGNAYVARAEAYNRMGQYDKALNDVHSGQNLNAAIPSELIDSLNKSSGKNN